MNYDDKETALDNKPEDLHPYVLRSFQHSLISNAEQMYLIPYDSHYKWCELANNMVEFLDNYKEKLNNGGVTEDEEEGYENKLDRFDEECEKIGCALVFGEEWRTVWTSPSELKKYNEQLAYEVQFGGSGPGNDDSMASIHEAMYDEAADRGDGAVYLTDGVWLHPDGSLSHDDW